MNLKEVQALTNGELRIKVAESCGIKGRFHSTGCGVEFREDGKDYWQRIPDYPQDLNAMHEVEEMLVGILLKYGQEATCRYEYVLADVIGCHASTMFRWKLLHATARQRAEAFVLTMEK